MGTAGAGAKGYEDWHWGTPHKLKVKWDDPDYPEGDLIECGRLVEVHFREPGARKDTVVKLSRREANGSHLCFDPNHRFGRLYILSHLDFREKMRKKYRENPGYANGSKYREMPLTDLARAVGGRHGAADYPEVDAAPVGILTHLVYATDKRGDGYSFYIHKLGEESGLRPALAVDGQGRMWIAGGNYLGNPTPGITD